MGDVRTEHSYKCPRVCYYWFRVLSISTLGPGKIGSLLNFLRKYEHNDKTYLYIKDSTGHKYLMSKKRAIAVKHSKDPNAFIDFSGNHAWCIATYR